MVNLIYQIFYEKINELKKQLTDLLKKKFIQPNTSFFDTSVLFVHKKKGTLKLCINYQALNKSIIKN